MSRYPTSRFQNEFKQGGRIFTSGVNSYHNPPVFHDNYYLSAIFPLTTILPEHSEEAEKFRKLLQPSQSLAAGDYIYHAGDHFTSVYAVCTGTVITINADNGCEQIAGFYLAGEVAGVDGVATNHYVNSAIAGEPVDICEIPLLHLEERSLEFPSLLRHFFHVISREISDDQRLIAQRNNKEPVEKIATLLLNLSARNYRRHLSATALRLPMPPAKIGTYLALSVETLNAVLHHFQQQAAITIEGKDITITNIDILRSYINPADF